MYSGRAAGPTGTRRASPARAAHRAPPRPPQVRVTGHHVGVAVQPGRGAQHVHAISWRIGAQPVGHSVRPWASASRRWPARSTVVRRVDHPPRGQQRRGDQRADGDRTPAGGQAGDGDGGQPRWPARRAAPSSGARTRHRSRNASAAATSQAIEHDPRPPRALGGMLATARRERDADEGGTPDEAEQRSGDPRRVHQVLPVTHRRGTAGDPRCHGARRGWARGRRIRVRAPTRNRKAAAFWIRCQIHEKG